MGKIIGIDLGTSSTKLLLMDETGTILNTASREYPLEFPAPGWSQQAPQDWHKAVMEGIPQLLEGFDGKNVAGLNANQRARLRNQRIGFVFQNFNLLSKLTAQANVALPLIYAGVGEEERMERAKKALEAVGLGERLDHKPMEMSGGQRQRVAIARTLAPKPKVLFMDEPLSNLDARLRLQTREEIKKEQDRIEWELLCVEQDLWEY